MKKILVSLLVLAMMLAFTVPAFASPFALPRGDVNLDRRVTLQDVNLVLKHIIGTIQLTGRARLNADCNIDGVIDMQDALLICRMAEHIPN